MPEQLKLMRADEIRPGMWVDCHWPVEPLGGVMEHGGPLGWRAVTEVTPGGANRLVLRCGEGIVSASHRTVHLVGVDAAPAAPDDELEELRGQIGTWAQMLQNGDGHDSHEALCEMLDEADKGVEECRWKYDPRED